ncbi:hypothetical protein ACFX15_002541 [Malus domestica]
MPYKIYKTKGKGRNRSSSTMPSNDALPERMPSKIYKTKGKGRNRSSSTMPSNEKKLIKTLKKVSTKVASSACNDVKNMYNHVYVEEFDRILMKRDAKFVDHNYANVKRSRSFFMTFEVLAIILECLKRDEWFTKCGLYVTIIPNFSHQANSDIVIDEVACKLECTQDV